MDSKKDFVAHDRIQVIIPYSDLEKIFHSLQRMDDMEKYIKRLDEQYAAIRGMFSECIEKIGEIQRFVQD